MIRYKDVQSERLLYSIPIIGLFIAIRNFIYLCHGDKIYCIYHSKEITKEECIWACIINILNTTFSITIIYYLLK